MLAGVAGGGDLALDAALAEPARDHQSVEAPQPVALEQVGHGGGLDPLDLDLGPVVEAGVAQRLDHREIGVGQVDVLADDADPDRADGRGHLVDQALPPGQVDRVVGQVDLQQVEQVAVEALLVQDEGDLVDVAGVDAETTACMGTSHSSEILRLRSSEIIRSERQTMTSGWMPWLRRSVTECWVGLVFCSPDGRR